MTGGFGDAAARHCFGAAAVLGWRPEDFWNATPAELALALSPPGEPGDAPDAETIEELRRRFPDK
ncbi:MAG: phage tail assembly chaperone [Sphingomicrobium sp.]